MGYLNRGLMLDFFCLYWLLCLANRCELSIKFAAKKKRENFPLQPRKKKEKIIFILLVFFFFFSVEIVFFFFFSTLTTSACQQLIRVHKHQLALHASNKRKKKAVY